MLAYSIRNRRRKARVITEFLARTGGRTVILAGAVAIAAEENPNEAIVELAVAEHAVITSAFNLEAVESPWHFVVADARFMPYRADAADVVLSNAVVEHVGGPEDQRAFVAEHARVGRHWVITTPNRWAPVESHTSKVFRHWSRMWRSSRTEFTRLLSRREFSDLLPTGSVIIGRWWSPTFIGLSGRAPLDRPVSGGLAEQGIKP